MTNQTTPTPDHDRDVTAPMPQAAGNAYAPGLAQADGPAPKKSKKHLIGYPATALVALAIGASGGGDGAPAAAPVAASTVTVTQTVATPQPAQTVTQTVRETVTAAPQAAAPAPAAPAPAARIVVPDGVGLNYQQAQDLWRAAGLAVAPAIDATGANRLAVLDSNWVVLSQDLEPGTTVDGGSMITATIKKYTDG